MTWITTKEAAEILDFHPEHVRRLLRQKKLKGEKFAESWMVDKETVQALRKRLKGIAKRDPRRGDKYIA